MKLIVVNHLFKTVCALWIAVIGVILYFVNRPQMGVHHANAPRTAPLARVRALALVANGLRGLS